MPVEGNVCLSKLPIHLYIYCLYLRELIVEHLFGVCIRGGLKRNKDFHEAEMLMFVGEFAAHL